MLALAIAYWLGLYTGVGACIFAITACMCAMAKNPKTWWRPPFYAITWPITLPLIMIGVL